MANQTTGVGKRKKIHLKNYLLHIIWAHYDFCWHPNYVRQRVKLFFNFI